VKYAGTRSILAVPVLVAALWSTIDLAWAVRPDEMLSDHALETRARAIGQELRCLVCQNQSIDDSDADLAHDLRVLVRQRLLAGDSDEQVIQYMVARYGSYVLLNPPLDAETLLLWFGPIVLLLCAAGVTVQFYRRAPMASQMAPFSEEEYQRLANLVGGTDSEGKGAR